MVPQSARACDASVKLRRTLSTRCATSIEISLIPAVYNNLVTREAGEGYRVQYKATTLGSTSSPETYIFDPNELHFKFKLTTGITMLDIQIMPRLDV